MEQGLKKWSLHVLVGPSHDTAAYAPVSALEMVTEPGAMVSVPFAYELQEAEAAGRACAHSTPHSATPTM